MKFRMPNFLSRIKNPRFILLLKNKFILAGTAFLIWMFFFDDNDIVSQIRLRLKVSEYHKQKKYYEQRIAEVRKEKEELLTNQESLEKFAREKYMMKKDDEDLFVIVPEKEK